MLHFVNLMGEFHWIYKIIPECTQIFSFAAPRDEDEWSECEVKRSKVKVTVQNGGALILAQILIVFWCWCLRHQVLSSFINLCGDKVTGCTKRSGYRPIVKEFFLRKSILWVKELRKLVYICQIIKLL